MRVTTLAIALVLCACAGAELGPAGRPPADPIAEVTSAELHGRGLGFAHAGDYVRAEQYLQAAMLKGHDEAIIVPQLVKVCVAASRVRAALAYARPYLARHGDDGGMRYVVAHLELTLGNTRVARTELETLLEREEDFADARYTLALIASAEGEVAEARRLLDRYLEAAPSGAHAGEARGLLADLEPQPTRRRRR